MAVACCVSGAAETDLTVSVVGFVVCRLVNLTTLEHKPARL